MRQMLTILLAAAIIAGCHARGERDEPTEVRLPEDFEVTTGQVVGYDGFYTKHAEVCGIHIASSANVPDEALAEAAYLIASVLAGREDMGEVIGGAGVHLAVMAHNEFTTDIPEHADLTPAAWWDRRARGLGATPHRPAFSAGAENLLGYPGDPYRGENILIHEFAHVIHEFALAEIDPTFDGRLRAAFDHAKATGLWEDTYAMTNHAEYWAEGVQVYFECNPENTNHSHGEINLRTELEAYDPALYALLAEAFPDNDFIYTTPRDRLDAPHLAAWDFESAPTFVWPEDSD